MLLCSKAGTPYTTEHEREHSQTKHRRRSDREETLDATCDGYEHDLLRKHTERLGLQVAVVALKLISHGLQFCS